MASLLQDLETGLEDFEEAASYLGELVGEPGEDGNGSKGSDADEEVDTQLVGSGVGDAAED